MWVLVTVCNNVTATGAWQSVTETDCVCDRLCVLCVRLGLSVTSWNTDCRGWKSSRRVSELATGNENYYLTWFQSMHGSNYDARTNGRDTTINNEGLVSAYRFCASDSHSVSLQRHNRRYKFEYPFWVHGFAERGPGMSPPTGLLNVGGLSS